MTALLYLAVGTARAVPIILGLALIALVVMVAVDALAAQPRPEPDAEPEEVAPLVPPGEQVRARSGVTDTAPIPVASRYGRHAR